MKKIIYFIYLTVLSTNLNANESEKRSLIHSKQEGRYEVVHKLPQKAKSFDKAFDYAKPFATLRVANIESRIDDNNLSGTSATAFGGMFGFDSASFYNTHFHIAAYASQKIFSLYPSASSSLTANPSFTNADGNGYAYIGEVSLVYESEVVSGKLGRIRIETPYADSDDIRMSPNSFEGGWVNAVLPYDLQAQMFYLSRWAGTDSGAAQDEFKALVDGGYGALGTSIRYSLNEKNELAFWYYNVDKLSDIFYLEAAGEYQFNTLFHMEYGLQFSHMSQRDDSKVQGDVIGAMLIADVNAFYGGLAYNHVIVDEDNYIVDGFGGGPYYTSLDEQTIGAFSELAVGNDIDVYKISMGVNFEAFSRQKIIFEYIHGHFYFSQSSIETRENDLVFTYELNNRVSLQSIYSDIDFINLPSGEDIDFRRLVSKIEYYF